MHAKKYRFLLLSLCTAIILDILPLPGFTTWLRPHWTLLFIIYWMVETRTSIALTLVFLLGLLLDALNGSVLGLHPFTFILIAYFAKKTGNLMRSYTMLQQQIIIFLLTFLYQLTTVIILLTTHQASFQWLYWIAPITSALLWPWIVWVESYAA